MKKNRSYETVSYGLTEFHEYLQDKNKEVITKLKTELSVFKLQRSNARKKIKRSEHQINEYCNLSCSQLITRIDKQRPVQLVFRSGVDKRSQTSVIEGVELMQTAVNKIVEIEQQLQSYLCLQYEKVVINDVIRTYFLLWKTNLLEFGKTLILRANLGKLLFIRTEAKEVIDWPKSLALKEQLIKENRTVLEHYRDENGVIIGHNNGQPYLLTRKTSGVKLKWLNKRSVPNSKIFHFEKGITFLTEYCKLIRNNPHHLGIYKLRNGKNIIC